MFEDRGTRKDVEFKEIKTVKIGAERVWDELCMETRWNVRDLKTKQSE